MGVGPDRSAPCNSSITDLTCGSLSERSRRTGSASRPATCPPPTAPAAAHHPFYAGVHLGTIAGVLLWAGGVVALTGTLSDPLAVLSGRLARKATHTGAAIFITDFTIDGDGYAGWLGWSAVAVGAFLFQPTLFPGALLYGVLVPIVVQLWSVALGLTMWRRSRVTHSTIEG